MLNTKQNRPSDKSVMNKLNDVSLCHVWLTIISSLPSVMHFFEYAEVWLAKTIYNVFWDYYRPNIQHKWLTPQEWTLEHIKSLPITVGLIDGTSYEIYRSYIPDKKDFCI